MFRICLKIDKASRTAFPISKGRFHKGFEKKKINRKSYDQNIQINTNEKIV